MIITGEVLGRFGACQSQKEMFAATFPDGLDISGLWGDTRERTATWERLLKIKVVKYNLGWAIFMGIVPARIVANLGGANLSGANLSWASLGGANLSQASLGEASLYGANLSRANLSDANLCGANLSRANLYGANLSRASLGDADLYGANLREANLSGATYNKYTIWPDGFVPGAEMRREQGE